MCTFLGWPWDFGSCLYQRVPFMYNAPLTLLLYEGSSVLWLVSMLFEAVCALKRVLDLAFDWNAILPPKEGTSGIVSFTSEAIYPSMLHNLMFVCLGGVVYQHLLLYKGNLKRFYQAAVYIFVGTTLISIWTLIGT